MSAPRKVSFAVQPVIMGPSKSKETISRSPLVSVQVDNTTKTEKPKKKPQEEESKAKDKIEESTDKNPQNSSEQVTPKEEKQSTQQTKNSTEDKTKQKEEKVEQTKEKVEAKRDRKSEKSKSERKSKTKPDAGKSRSDSKTEISSSAETKIVDDKPSTPKGTRDRNKSKSKSKPKAEGESGVPKVRRTASSDLATKQSVNTDSGAPLNAENVKTETSDTNNVTVPDPLQSDFVTKIDAIESKTETVVNVDIKPEPPVEEKNPEKTIDNAALPQTSGEVPNISDIENKVVSTQDPAPVEKNVAEEIKDSRDDQERVLIEILNDATKLGIVKTKYTEVVKIVEFWDRIDKISICIGDSEDVKTMNDILHELYISFKNENLFTPSTNAILEKPVFETKELILNFFNDFQVEAIDKVIEIFFDNRKIADFNNLFARHLTENSTSEIKSDPTGDKPVSAVQPTETKATEDQSAPQQTSENSKLTTLEGLQSPKEENASSSDSFSRTSSISSARGEDETSAEGDTLGNESNEPLGTDLTASAALNAEKKKRKKVKRRKSIAPPAEDIRYFTTNDGTKIITAATTERIVDLLAADTFDKDLNYNLLLTYDYYLNYKKFFQLLTDKFNSVAAKLEENKVESTRILLRIVNIVKIWAEIHICKIKSHQNVLNTILSFSENVVKPIIGLGASSNLTNSINTKLEILDNGESIDLQIDPSVKLPKPKTSGLSRSSSLDQIGIESVHPIELARQLTLIDHKLYRAIKVNELLHLNWTSEERKYKKAPNILAMIDQFNKVGKWTTTQIVTHHQIDQRTKILSRLIQAAYECYNLHNYNSAMAILSGLKNSCVSRLQNTWNSLQPATWDMWEELNEVFVITNNFSNLREIIKKSPPPNVPYLGVYLSDLAFKEVESNFVDGLVNVGKLGYIAGVIKQIQSNQTTPFCLQDVKFLQDFISNLSFISENDFYTHSKHCEKISRRLSASFDPEQIVNQKMDPEQTAKPKLMRISSNIFSPRRARKAGTTD